MVFMFMYSDGGSFMAYRVFMFMYSDGGSFRAYRVFMFMYCDGWSFMAYRCTFQILGGWQGRRTSHVPLSLPPP